MNITPEMVQALAALREFAKATNAERYPHPIDAEAAKAVDLLDNADFFTAIDEADTQDEEV